MEKRGQLLGQPFIMIFGLIAGALILAWGIYQVYQLIDLSKDVQVEDYINGFSKDVQRYYYLEQGSSNKFKISLPQEYSYICFVDRVNPFYCSNGPIPCIKPPNYNHPFVIARKSDNVFVYSKSDVLAYHVPYLRTPATENPLCVKNMMNVLLTSKGTYVEVSHV